MEQQFESPQDLAAALRDVRIDLATLHVCHTAYRNKYSYRQSLVDRLHGCTLRRYQQNTTAKYIRGLKQHMDAKAASLGRRTSLSCNNGGSDWSTPYDQCDYGLGELMIGSATPQTLEAIFTTMPPAGKMQVMTSE